MVQNLAARAKLAPEICVTLSYSTLKFQLSGFNRFVILRAFQRLRVTCYHQLQPPT